MGNRKRDDRDPVTTGIYRDSVRWYATVRVRGAGDVDKKTGKRKDAFREKRFPISAPITVVQAWREDQTVKLLDVAERGTKSEGFSRDADRYVNTFTKHLASAKSRRLEVECWKRVFLKRPRGTIKPADVAKARMDWLAAGLSPKTVNNRVDTLRHLYRCLDGRRAWTPCDDLNKLHVHRQPMQFVTNETILAVDKRLQELEQIEWHKKEGVRGAKVRARFRVTVSTGRRPSELMRTIPSDVNMERRIWLPRDGKGGFSPGVYLNDDMLAAWQLFIDADAWGKYNTGRQADTLYRAGWPKGIQPYQARHTLGITASEGGVDLDDVGAMLGHKRRETTRKHYVPVLNSRMQRASESLEGRFKAWPTVQTAVQTNVSGGVKTRPETSDRIRPKKAV